jgi:hypothetical protein
VQQSARRKVGLILNTAAGDVTRREIGELFKRLQSVEAAGRSTADQYDPTWFDDEPITLIVLDGGGVLRNQDLGRGGPAREATG